MADNNDNNAPEDNAPDDNNAPDNNAPGNHAPDYNNAPDDNAPDANAPETHNIFDIAPGADIGVLYCFASPELPTIFQNRLDELRYGAVEFRRRNYPGGHLELCSAAGDWLSDFVQSLLLIAGVMVLSMTRSARLGNLPKRHLTSSIALFLITLFVVALFAPSVCVFRFQQRIVGCSTPMPAINVVLLDTRTNP